MSMIRRATDRHPRRIPVLGVASLAAAVTMVVGCGGATGAPTSSGSAANQTPPPGSGATAQPTATPSGGPTTGHLGDTLTYIAPGASPIHVTLVKVFDPATGFDPNDAPPTGTHWVGFEGTLIDDGQSSDDDSSQVLVVGSDGQTYGINNPYNLTVFDGCDEVGDVDAGQTATFCTAVGLPQGVTVAKILYNPVGLNVATDGVLFWTVP
jgi:hypothetical protein